MTICEHCGGRLPTEPEPNPITAADLLTSCRVAGHWVGPGDVVREDAAAQLIGWSLSTIRNRRYSDQPIAYTYHNKRVVYRLDNIAGFLKQQN